MNIRIENAHIIDPHNQIDHLGHLDIKEGVIQAVDLFDHSHPNTPLDTSNTHTPKQTIDATGMLLCPGFTDLLSYLEHKKSAISINTETKAAASAGFTHLAVSPDTSTPIDTSALLKHLQTQAHKANYCQILPIAALTQGLKGQHLTNMYELAQVGALGLSNGQHDIMSNTTLIRCYEYASNFGLKVFIHPRDGELSQGHMHQGALATRLGLKGIPVVAETLAISRQLLAIEHTGVKAHFHQISSLEGVDLIRQAKQKGLAITADVDLAHLVWTQTQVDDYNSQYHTQPPLRSEADRQALIAGLIDNTLDVIVTAHQPHVAAAKQAPFANTACGMAMYDLWVPLLLNLQATHADKLTLSHLISKISSTPAQIIDHPISGIQQGNTANLCLIHPGHTWQLNATSQQSNGANQSLLGKQLLGRNKLTIMQGALTWQEPSLGHLF